MMFIAFRETQFLHPLTKASSWVKKVLALLVLAPFLASASEYDRRFGDETTCAVAEALINASGVPDVELSKAYYAIGRCHFWGHGRAQSGELAEKYLRKASSLGHAEGTRLLANLLALYLEDPQKTSTGFKLMQQLAESGHSFAQANLALYYVRGYGVDQDNEKAIEYFEKAARAGINSAQFVLAHAYERGLLGLPVDQLKHEYWLKLQPKLCTYEYSCDIANDYRGARSSVFEKDESLERYYAKRCERPRN